MRAVPCGRVDVHPEHAPGEAGTYCPGWVLAVAPVTMAGIAVTLPRSVYDNDTLAAAALSLARITLANSIVDRGLKATGNRIEAWAFQRWTDDGDGEPVLTPCTADDCDEALVFISADVTRAD